MSSTNTMPTGTPVKLRSGAWGVKVPSNPQPKRGDAYAVVTKEGRRRGTAHVSVVVWSNAKVAICATAEGDAQIQYTPPEFEGA